MSTFRSFVIKENNGAISGVQIDSAKRKYNGVVVLSELREIKKRPYLQAEGVVLRDDGTLLITEKGMKY